MHGIIGSPTKFSATSKLTPQILKITCTHINIPATNGAYFKNIILNLWQVFIIRWFIFEN